MTGERRREKRKNEASSFTLRCQSVVEKAAKRRVTKDKGGRNLRNGVLDVERRDTVLQNAEPFENKSIGVIVANTTAARPKFLIVCRKDSHHFVQLLKGDYEQYHLANIQLGITKEEGEKIKQAIDQSDFDSVWKSVFMNPNTRKKLERSARQTFMTNGEEIKNLLEDEEFTIKLPDTPEWEIPKGRMDAGEEALETALRELREETGYTEADIDLVRSEGDPVIIEEKFVDSNFRLSGRQILINRTYFLAIAKRIQTTVPPSAKDEVSEIAWKEEEEVEALFGCSIHTGDSLRHATKHLISKNN